MFHVVVVVVVVVFWWWWWYSGTFVGVRVCVYHFDALERHSPTYCGVEVDTSCFGMSCFVLSRSGQLLLLLLLLLVPSLLLMT
jgi:hypothetical protein